MWTSYHEFQNKIKSKLHRPDYDYMHLKQTQHEMKDILANMLK